MTELDPNKVYKPSPASGEDAARAFFRAWNAQDLDAMEAIFVADADFVNVVGFWWKTRRQIRKAHDYGFRRIFQNARVEITELKVRSLTPEIEVIHAVSTLDGQSGADGEEAGQRIAVISMVVQRQADAAWRIVSCQNTDRAEGADTHLNAAGGLRPASYRQD